MQIRTSIAPAVGGAFLLLIGVVLLIDAMGFELRDRWLAGLLLLPASLVLFDAVRLGLRQSRIDLLVISRLLVGIAYAAIAILLVMGLETSVVLPALVVVLGLGAIVRALLAR